MQGKNYVTKYYVLLTNNFAQSNNLTNYIMKYSEFIIN